MRLTSQVHSCSNTAATARRVATGKSNNEWKQGFQTQEISFPATLKTHPRSHQHFLISDDQCEFRPGLSILWWLFGGWSGQSEPLSEVALKLRFLRFLQPRSLSASCCHHEKSPPWWARLKRHRHAAWFVVGQGQHRTVPQCQGALWPKAKAWLLVPP